MTTEFRVPVSEADQEKIEALMKAAEELFPGRGVTVMVFDFGQSGRMHYGSNADRQDVAKAMLEWVERVGSE